MSIDCPADCAYLLAAHRYEDEHRRQFPPDTPFMDTRLSSEIVQMRQQLLSSIAFQIAKFCSTNATAYDPDVLAALVALAEAYKTLASGIVFEKPPVYPVQRDLYATLSAFVSEAKRQTPPGTPPIKDIEVFQLLVFLQRMGMLRTNGRPHARRFIEYLRGQFPGAEELRKEESRIITP